MTNLKNALIVLSALMSLSAFADQTPTPVVLPPAVESLHNALIQIQTCQAGHETETASYDLGMGKTMYLVQCTMAAYQGTARAYITNQYGDVAQVSIMDADNTVGIAPTLDLMSAGYDPKKQTISTLSRGRGIGDCGSSTVSELVLARDGEFAIKTTQIRYKAKCDGKMNQWPLIYSRHSVSLNPKQ